MKTLIRRPSRYQQNKAGYQLTLSGLCMGKAIQAVQNAETKLHTTPAPLLQSPDAWNITHARYDRARRKLKECRNKISAGHTAADRTC